MEAWDQFLRDLEQKFGKQPVNTWLKPLKVVQYDACNLYLEAENSFQISWFEEHVRSIAKKEFVNNNAHLIKIHFSAVKKKKRARAIVSPQMNLEINSDHIDSALTFSNFIFEKENTLTVQFFKQLSPGLYNPLFLYGPVGIGKSHLISACANKLTAQGLKVFYVHTETFTQHVVEAIRSSEMRKFREIYRNQDVLIIDDIQYLARRMATQEELFHTFNTLHTAGKQIILTSQLPPSKLDDIEPRLISRFEWGIVLELFPLSSKKMGQVLRNKARLHHFSLSEPVTDFLIEKFSTSSKSMMRGLEALMLRHRVSQPITLEQAEELLTDLLGEEKKLKITPEKILSATSAYFGIRPDDILGKSQSKECAFPRKIAMYLCRIKLNLPYLAIGRFFRRDHSTVMTGVKQIEKKSDLDDIATTLTEIENSIKS